MDKSGQTFGQLTVIRDDGNAQVLCLCICGKEQLFPRSISKPSYKGRLMCNYCRGADCVICGVRIPQTTGRVSITCCDEHAKRYASFKEKRRYQKIKGTEHFKETRRAYIEKLKERYELDPGLYMTHHFRHYAAVKRFRSRLTDEKRDVFLVNQRSLRKKKLEALKGDPVKYEAFREKCREWYRSLSDDDYKRIFGRVRKYRKC